MEPPWWIEPVRHALGAMLLEAGKAAAAERVYREDLARFPMNVWGLVGLDRSLTAQGKPDAGVRADLAKAQAASEDKITSSHH
jgi:hypothetical protein